MRFDVVTIFPEYLAVLDVSLLGRARREGLVDVHVHDLRDFTVDRHRTVDDTPFGGGAGMVMRPDVWGRALDDLLPDPSAGARTDTGADAAARGAHLVVPTPSGDVFTQRRAEELATLGKGQAVVVIGHVETDSWEAEDGSGRRYRDTVVVDAIGASLGISSGAGDDGAGR